MKDNNPALDGIRGFAVLIVFLSHTAGREQALHPLLEFQGIGHIGVYLFFVLSGYLLTHNLLSEHERFGSISFKKFFIRRFMRIAPLYYIVVTVVFLNQQITGHITKQYLHVWGGGVGYLKHLFFIKGDGVFWTIAAEFSFYLILPFLVIYLIRKGDKSLQILIFLSLVFFFWGLLTILKVIPDELAPKVVDIHHRSQFFEVFLCGVIAAFVERKVQGYMFSGKYHDIIILIGLFSFIVTMSLTLILVSNNFIGFERSLYHFRWLSLLYGLVFAVVIISSKFEGILKSFFQLRILRYMGLVGFSWYLIHFSILEYVNGIILTPSHRFLTSFILCSIVAGLLYLFIELPFIKLGKKLTARKKTHI